MRDTHPAPAEPRESLPPCTKLVLCDSRMVALVDQAVCKHGWGDGRFRFQRGMADGTWEQHPGHPEVSMPGAQSLDEPLLATDDAAEAQAAFQRGAEWVRTGVLE